MRFDRQSAVIHKVVEPFRQFGITAGFMYAADRLLNRLSEHLRFRYYEFLVQPISQKPLLPASMARQFEIREIRNGDSEIGVMPARPEIKQARFRQNAVCLGIFNKKHLAGYIWLCFRKYEEDEARCTYILNPEASSVFDFDLYVFPEYRIGPTFLAVWNAANAFLSEHGVARSYSRMTRFNVASRRAHQHLGAQVVARACFVQAWDFELMLSTISPYLFLSLGESRRARLVLRS
jgi:hypothetical protein